MKEELEHNKIYFISYGEQTQLVVRIKDCDTMRYNFYSHLHYWNGFETFREEGYSITSGVEEIRPATLPEKHLLIRHEIEHGLH